MPDTGKRIQTEYEGMNDTGTGLCLSTAELARLSKLMNDNAEELLQDWCGSAAIGYAQLVSKLSNNMMGAGQTYTEVAGVVYETNENRVDMDDSAAKAAGGNQ